MTISELDRLHSQLSRLEDVFSGYKVEIVGGNIVMSPVRPFHGETIRLLWNSLESRLADTWGVVSDVAFPFTPDYELCPDLAVIPRAEAAKNLSAYPADLIEVAIEVVSPTNAANDYKTKDERYAAQGIGSYLIFDPYEAHCVTHWHPGPHGYLGRDTVPYGEPVSVETSVGRLTFDTARLPVDRKR